jgi:hypothetical protein
VNDDIGLAQEPQADLYSARVEGPPSEALQVTTIENRMTSRQAIQDTFEYSFRLKPDRRRGTRAYAGCDRRQRR